MSDVLGEFLSSFGFGGAETGADITRMLGVQDPALQQRFGRGLDPLFGTVRTGLGELPELLATLTGQAQTAAGIGRERIGRGFQAGRAGLEERGVELGRAGRIGVARAGFAGAGAPGRRERLGRRQLGRQFMDILGARRTGLAGVEAGLERELFGAGEAVESRRAGLLGSLGTGIQNLLNALISGGVQFGAGETDGDPIPPVPNGDFPVVTPDPTNTAYLDWLKERGFDAREAGDPSLWQAYQNYLKSRGAGEGVMRPAPPSPPGLLGVL